MKDAFVPQTLEEKKSVEDAALVTNEAMKALVEVTFVMTPLVANKFVEVTFVVVPFTKFALVPVRFVIEPLVEVTLVAVALVATRPVMEPVAAEIPPVTFTVEAFTLAKFEVPETFKFDAVAPPKKVTAIEVVAPRAVTMARVSVEYIETQLVPFARQTF